MFDERLRSRKLCEAMAAVGRDDGSILPGESSNNVSSGVLSIALTRSVCVCGDNPIVRSDSDAGVTGVSG